MKSFRRLGAESPASLHKICLVEPTGNRPIKSPQDKFNFKVVDVIFNLSTSYTSWDRPITLTKAELVPA
jgi:hypothetical protein